MRSIKASKGISKFTQSRCSVTPELEGQETINETLPHLSWHLKGICEKEGIWLEDHGERVRGYEGVPSHEERHKSGGSIKARQESVRDYPNCVNLPKLGKSEWDQELGKVECVFLIMRWCLFTPESPKYLLPIAQSISVLPSSPYAAPSCSLSLCYPCMSVWQPLATPCYTEWWWWRDMDFNPTTTASKCISKFSQLESPSAPLITLEYCVQPDWLSVYRYRHR